MNFRNLFAPSICTENIFDKQSQHAQYTDLDDQQLDFSKTSIIMPNLFLLNSMLLSSAMAEWSW